jgi:hypothetical protein
VVGISHSIYFQTQGTIQKKHFQYFFKMCKIIITKICCRVLQEQPTRQQQQQQQQQLKGEENEKGGDSK